jgi:hypothetical protein
MGKSRGCFIDYDLKGLMSVDKAGHLRKLSIKKVLLKNFKIAQPAESLFSPTSPRVLIRSRRDD